MPLHDVRSVVFPYHLERKPGGYVVKNREYLELGSTTRRDHEVIPIKITPTLAKKLSVDGSANIDSIYLYDDGCYPTRSAADMKTYLARVALLMKVKLKRS